MVVPGGDDDAPGLEERVRALLEEVPELVYDASEAVVGGDYVAPRRKRRLRIGVEREKLLRRKGAETEKLQPSQLTVEAARAGVEVLLFGLRAVLDSVAEPERDVGREAEKRAGAADERFKEPESAGGVARRTRLRQYA